MRMGLKDRMYQVRTALNRLSLSQKRLAAALCSALLLCLLTVQLVHVAHLYSLNWDEAHHLYDGYLIWHLHDYRANAEVPPLVKLAAALPLLHMHPALPSGTGTSQASNAFLAGRLFVFENGGDRLIYPARLMCILISLLAAILIYIVGKRYFGFVAAACALFFFVFDPNVLAHGSLISTDMASACFLFGTVYGFYRCTEAGNWRWFLLTGLLAGCALTAKFTGILIVPMLLALSAAEAIRLRSRRVLYKGFAVCLGVLAFAWIILWAFYGFRYAPAPHGLQLSPQLGPYLASLPNPANGRMLAVLAHFRVFPEAYIWGLANTKHTEWEYTSYFFGHVYRHGPWQYFPAAFLIKSTLPLLVLLVLVPLILRKGGRRYTRQLIYLLVPVAIYLTVVITSHFDIGARHLMPIYPFLYVLAGLVSATLLRRGAAGVAVVAVLLAWQVITTVRVAPDYMAYGNEAWGGPLRVRQYLSDANVDWGQQLKTVKAYLDRNGDPNCWFAYFPDGAVQAQDYGIHCHRLPTPSGLWWLGLTTNVPPEISGTVLISESDLDGVESGDGALNPYAAFQKLKPVAILQDGVYVYKGSFAVPLAAAWVDIRHSADAMQQGQLTHALVLAQQAVALAPQSTRAQLQLAEVLSRQKQFSAARIHYLLAEQDLKHERPDLQEEELGPQIHKGLASVP